MLLDERLMGEDLLLVWYIGVKYSFYYLLSSMDKYWFIYPQNINRPFHYTQLYYTFTARCYCPDIKKSLWISRTILFSRQMINFRWVQVKQLKASLCQKKTS